jgi:hypothetical protein
VKGHETAISLVPIDRRRMEIYEAMNGCPYLTQRQIRRIKRKRNHAMAPFGKKAE